jgi:hypothetical protein
MDHKFIPTDSFPSNYNNFKHCRQSWASFHGTGRHVMFVSDGALNILSDKEALNAGLYV